MDGKALEGSFFNEMFAQHPLNKAWENCKEMCNELAGDFCIGVSWPSHPTSDQSYRNQETFYTEEEKLAFRFKNGEWEPFKLD